MLLYVLRHGETHWNKIHRLQGRSDIPLNENGIKLAEMTAEGLKDVAFDLCISSPLIRAQETAKIVLGGRKIPFILDDRIQEISFGEYEGKYIMPDGKNITDPKYLKFRSAPFEFEGMPGGESIQELICRANLFLDELIQKKEYQDKTILLSTHGCLYRGILNRFYENPSDFWQNGVPRNCSVSVLEIKNKKPEIIKSDILFYDPTEMEKAL